MLGWMLDVPKNLILAGWCRVDHHSTEYLIIGILIKPTIAIKPETLFALSSSLMILSDKIYKT